MLHPSNLKTTLDYETLSRQMERLREEDPEEWLNRQLLLSQTDLTWLLTEVLSTRFWKHPEFPEQSLFRNQWLIDRAKEIQDSPGDELNIFSRGHGKTTIQTFARPIQILLNEPNASIGIFAVTKDIAETFVGMILEELERNDFLKRMADHIFYTDPVHESPLWSRKDGAKVKRSLVFKDPSLRPFGLLDSATTGARLSHAIYDDCVNEKVVTNPAQIAKANARWEMSLNLGMPGTKRWYVGTFYASGDTYHHMIERGIKLNLRACYEIDYSRSKFEKNGIPLKLVVNRERPQLYTKMYLEKQEQQMGRSTFAIQMLCTPLAQEITDFNIDWVKRYSTPPKEARNGMNTLMLVDPAYSKGQNSHSRTAIGIVGLNGDQNYYLLDGVLDRLNLGQRLDAIFDLHAKWEIDEVRYEQNGWGSDLESIRVEMERRNYRFTVVPVHPGSTTKTKRIERLIPILRAGRFYVPERGIPYIMRETNQNIDLVQWWIDKELLPFPNVVHLDFSDALSRIEEPECNNRWPMPTQRKSHTWRDEFYEQDRKPAIDWMRM